MKRFLSLIAVAGLAFCTLGFPSCGDIYHSVSSATTYKASAQTTQQIVVNSEKVIREARDTVDVFLQLEHNHREFVKKNFPSVHAAAERLRKDAPDVLIAADRVKNTFKHNRTPENEANLNSVIATVKGITAEAKELTKQLKDVTP